jgi:hypothetical protein
MLSVLRVLVEMNGKVFMKRFLRLLSAAAVVAGTMLGGPTLPAQAAKQDHAVFVQTNNSNGNSIMAFRRNADGTLTPAATYPTGGKGGRADGAASDPLASRGGVYVHVRLIHNRGGK